MLQYVTSIFRKKISLRASRYAKSKDFNKARDAGIKIDAGSASPRLNNNMFMLHDYKSIYT
jgi:hypothetical protein